MQKENIVSKKFYTAIYARGFKSLFVNENDYSLMEALLSTCLDTGVKILKFFNVELNRVGEYFNSDMEFVQINLAFNIGKRKNLKEEYILYDRKSKKTYLPNFKVIVFNMDMILELWYHKNEKEIDRYKYLIMVDLEKEKIAAYTELSLNKIAKLKGKLNNINDYLHLS